MHLCVWVEKMGIKTFKTGSHEFCLQIFNSSGCKHCTFVFATIKFTTLRMLMMVNYVKDDF